MSSAAEAAVISDYLTGFAAALSGPYTTRVITGQVVPYLRVVSQISPEITEDILIDFATDPPGYLTSEGHRLGAADNPAGAAIAIARFLRGND